MAWKKLLPEPEIIKLYTDGISLRDLAKKYNVDRGVIKRTLLKNKVELRTLSEANRIYSFDENTFEEIDSHEKAYWLGFLASDGSIYGNSVRIGLSFKDFSHLESFKKFLKSDHPIHTYHPIFKGKTYKSCEFAIRSDKMVSDLGKLNIGANKSKTLQPSQLKNKYINSYLLGVIDGDGGFYVDKKGQIRMNVISSLSMCQFIMTTLVANCNITPTKIIPEKRSEGMYYCYFGGNNKIKNIINFLYRDTNIYLERKFKIVEYHFKE